MPLRLPVQGILPPIPTNFDASGGVDRRAITANIRRWSQTKLAGVLALGSNGEASLLDEAECDDVVETVRAALPTGRLLLVGVGRESTRATIAAALRAARQGADAVLVRTPSAFRTQMTNDALTAHFTAVADASPVPVLLYNLPGATGLTLTRPVVARLAEHPNVAGMKETSPDLERLGEFSAIRPGGFAVMCGWAPVVYPALMSGAAGAILAAANVVPEVCLALFDHARAGRHKQAIELQRALTPLAQMVTTIHGIGGLKAALELAGYQGGPVRAPLLPVSAKVREEIGAALTTLIRSPAVTAAS